MIDLLSHYEEEGRGAWYSGRRYEEEEKEETSLVGCPLTTVVDSASLLTPPSPPQDVRRNKPSWEIFTSLILYSS